MTLQKTISPLSRPSTGYPQQTEPGDCLLLLHDQGPVPLLWSFQKPQHILVATAIHEVLDRLAELEAAVAAGLTAVGYLAYEAAPAFDEACRVHPSTALPLLWFALYEHGQQLPLWTRASSPKEDTPFELGPWTPSLSRVEYERGHEQIKEHIARGDSYQINYTWPLQSSFSGDPLAFFYQGLRAHRAPYSAYLDMGEHVICSFSPELFFEVAGEHITCRPMKGTAPRALTSHDDQAQIAALAVSEKDQAENIMIVDMIRNDLGKIAVPGSVQLDQRFHVESYPTLHQMTSTVHAQTQASYTEICKALFPCASVTGAPKIKTMELITELEPQPRGVYTGAIGMIAPDRKAQFNVAIRTLHFNRNTSLATYGTGSGVVWDSIADKEYDECLTKTRVLTQASRDFQLLETLLWTNDEGYMLLDAHLQRMQDSARYFGFSFERKDIEEALAASTQTFTDPPYRVRLLLAEDGATSVTHDLL